MSVAPELLDFERDVLRASAEVPVLVDFWAPWCAPCRTLGPILERLAARAGGRWRLVKLNTEQHPELATRYRITSIPAVKLFRRGEPVADFVGALPESAVARWLDAYIPSAAAELVTAARRDLETGDRAAAAAELRQALALEPSHIEGRVLLSQLIVLDEPDRVAELLEGIDEGDPLGEVADSMRFLAKLHQRRGAAPPDGVRPEIWQTYQEGIEALAARDFAKAVGRWLEVIRSDRRLDDDGARRACVAVFHLLGEEHEVTQAYRRSMASALY